MGIHLNVHRATFVADGAADTEVRVLPEPDGGVSFSINYGDDSQTVHSGLIGVGHELQTAEALQFVADVIGASIPGRLTPFVRGWVSTAADSFHVADRELWGDLESTTRTLLIYAAACVSDVAKNLVSENLANTPCAGFPEYSEAEDLLADAVINIMDTSHANGLRVAQLVETKIKSRSKGV